MINRDDVELIVARVTGLQPVPILSLRPTQMTVGMCEVKEGVRDVLVTVIADLTMVDSAAFWSVLDHRRAYPYDAKGARRHSSDIPKSVTGLKGDPFRSLAGEIRRAGGYAKDTTPFSAFLWADLFRRRLSRKDVDNDFASALEKVLAIARSRDAIYLPGWCGPSDG